jgi:hypothetical protein
VRRTTKLPCLMPQWKPLMVAKRPPAKKAINDKLRDLGMEERKCARVR